MIHLIGPLSLWERGGGTPVPPPATLPGGGGFPRTWKEPPDDRKLDRDELRAMLEAAFADAPRDPVVKATKRAHPVPEQTDRTIPRVDWSSLLRDLAACERALERYAKRVEAGRTMTQRGEKVREELRYSSESLHAMIANVRAARRARTLRAARAFLALQ